MLRGLYASLTLRGLKKLILSEAPASIPLLVKGSRELLATLPEPARTISRSATEGVTTKAR